MSLSGRMALRGSVTSISRPDPAAARTKPDGSAGITWRAAHATGVSCLIETIEAQLAQRLFGAEARVTYRALYPIGTDVQALDGITVTARFLSGRRFQVRKVLDLEESIRSDHLEVGLVETTETFA